MNYIHREWGKAGVRHTRGAACVHSFPDPIQFLFQFSLCVVLKLRLYVADWSTFLHYHSTNARTNQTTRKQTNKPAQGAEALVKKQPFSFLRNIRHFWNPSVVFTRAPHLAK